jgi:hypothetical protein
MTEVARKLAIGHFEDNQGVLAELTHIAAIIHEHEKRTVVKPQEVSCYIENGCLKPWDVQMHERDGERARLLRKKALQPPLTETEEARYGELTRPADYLKLQAELLGKDVKYALFISDNLMPNYQKAPPGFDCHDLAHNADDPKYKEYVHVLGVDTLQKVRRQNPQARLLFLSSGDPTPQERQALDEIGAIAVNKVSLEFLRKDESRVISMLNRGSPPVGAMSVEQGAYTLLSELRQALAAVHAERAQELPAIRSAYEMVDQYYQNELQMRLEESSRQEKRSR